MHPRAVRAPAPPSVLPSSSAFRDCPGWAFCRSRWACLQPPAVFPAVARSVRGLWRLRLRPWRCFPQLRAMNPECSPATNLPEWIYLTTTQAPPELPDYSPTARESDTPTKDETAYGPLVLSGE